MRALVAGVGVRGPGLDGWEAARAVLAGEQAYEAAGIVVPPATLLAANERRRAGLPVRLALAVASEAVAMAGLSPDAVRCVFGSASGEGAILHDLLETLASDAPRVSPTQFHNSVHNAVAGYWAMGAGSRQPMTCVAAGADTFAATLLKAMAEIAAERAPVLLCAYDVPLPEPLASKQPTGCAFGCALVLVPDDGMALARLTASWQARPAEPASLRPSGVALAAMSAGNPAARSVRLLQAIARQRQDQSEFSLHGGTLLLGSEPC